MNNKLNDNDNDINDQSNTILDRYQLERVLNDVIDVDDEDE